MRKRKWHAISFVLCPTLLRLVFVDAKLDSVLEMEPIFVQYLGMAPRKAAKPGKVG